MSLLSKVTTVAPTLPSRVYFYAQEKFGKTSFAAHAPKPLFIMTEGETGLLSLLESGRVPETAHFPDEAKSWEQFVDYVRAVRDEPHDYRTLVIDTANGAERMLVQHVCQTEFDGHMSGKEGYNSFGKGDLAAMPKWSRFLSMLDEIRVRRKMSIILLAHTKIRTVNNPEGPDYDQLRPEGVEKLWTLTHKWADVIAAGSYELVVKDDKVKSSRNRVIRAAGSLAVVAGNRYSMTEVIPCGNDAKSAFANFAKALAAAKSRGPRPAEAPKTLPSPGPEAPKTLPSPEPESQPQPQPGESEPAPVSEPESSEPETQPSDPQTEGAGSLDPAMVKRILTGCHRCELTWDQFLEQYGEDVGVPTDLMVPDLSDFDAHQVLAKLHKIYEKVHPRKAAKEAREARGEQA